MGNNYYWNDDGQGTQTKQVKINVPIRATMLKKLKDYEKLC
jgi:hypothetical protein